MKNLPIRWWRADRPTSPGRQGPAQRAGAPAPPPDDPPAEGPGLDDPRHAAARQRELRRFIRRQMLAAAGVAAVPVPGVDLVVNGRLLAYTVARINLYYGLAPEQLARLPRPVRNRVDQAISDAGSWLIGRVVTQAAVLTAAKGLGLRLGAQQAAKLAPVAGMVASAALSGWLFKRLCERHVAQCEQVCRQVPQLRAPPALLLEDDAIGPEASQPPG